MMVTGRRVKIVKGEDDPVERWALFVRDNPRKWKTIHTEFINAQFTKSEEFYKRLLKTPGGKKKIIELFNIRNRDAYPILNK